MVVITIEGISDLGFALWITFFSIIGSAVGVAFTIYKYFALQKEHKKYDFIKKIEYYETELIGIHEKYSDSEHEWHDCKNYADHSLVIIDRISYLRKKNLIDQDTIEYFQYWFAVGQSLFDWLKKMEQKGESNYTYFILVKDTIKNKTPSYELDAHLKNFLRLKKDDPNFKPE